jgi:hypothetical protein
MKTPRCAGCSTRQRTQQREAVALIEAAYLKAVEARMCPISMRAVWRDSFCVTRHLPFTAKQARVRVHYHGPSLLHWLRNGARHLLAPGLERQLRPDELRRLVAAVDPSCNTPQLVDRAVRELSPTWQQLFDVFKHTLDLRALEREGNSLRDIDMLQHSAQVDNFLYCAREVHRAGQALGMDVLHTLGALNVNGVTRDNMRLAKRAFKQHVKDKLSNFLWDLEQHVASTFGTQPTFADDILAALARVEREGTVASVRTLTPQQKEAMQAARDERYAPLALLRRMCTVFGVSPDTMCNNLLPRVASLHHGVLCATCAWIEVTKSLMNLFRSINGNDLLIIITLRPRPRASASASGRSAT